ncbi:MAG: tRNA (adenosine(37)-N6)-threonylcarbamoyltransferase complex dimerization subunit type 1 TsaB [Candidatus Buchananbacteria bacterium]
MYLIINTIDDKQIKVILAKSKDSFKIKTVKGERRQSEKLLLTIEKILKENGASLGKIKGIGVVSGPGGFTSVRIGVVVANSLAYALGKEVYSLQLSEFKDNNDLVQKILNGFINKKSKKIALPYYDREPNIG